MSYQDFKTAFDGYLATNWIYTPIHDFVNMPDDKVSGFDAWVSYINDSISDGIVSRSGDKACVESFYIMSVDIYTASASGDTEAVDLARKMNALFLGKRLTNNMWFIDTETEFGTKQQSEGKWFKTTITLTVEHRYQV